METEANQNKKRTRDQLEWQNPDITGFTDCSSYNDQKGREFFDGQEGIFVFPWIKDGLIFEMEEEYMELDYQVFSSCYSYLHDVNGTSDVNIARSTGDLRLCDPTLDDIYQGEKFDSKDSLYSFQVDDDLGLIDCIWSFVIDHPLLDIGLNKAQKVMQH